MKQQLFAIRDDKLKAYGTPFACRTPGEAERQLKTLVNDQQTKIAQYPEDFSLWTVGYYDDETGKLEPGEKPEHLVNALDVRGPHTTV